MQRLWPGRRAPRAVTAAMAADERVLAVSGELVATSLGLWVPDSGGHRRIGWHLVSKAVWGEGALTVTEATVIDTVAGVALLADQAPRSFPLDRPGKLPHAVRLRVTGGIRSSHHKELPGGGAWVVQRKVPGTGGVVLQLRADPGTDSAAVRALAGQLGTQVRRLLGDD